MKTTKTFVFMNLRLFRNVVFGFFILFIIIFFLIGFFYKKNNESNQFIIKPNNTLESNFPIDFEKYRLFLTSLGFTLARVDLNLGFMPDIVFAVDGLNDVSLEELRNSEEVYKDKKDILLLAKSLIEAKKLSEDQSISPYVLTRVWFTIGIPPSIRLTFQEKQAEATWLTAFFQNILHFLQSVSLTNSCLDI